jgi:hypothetical protein
LDGNTIHRRYNNMVESINPKLPFDRWVVSVPHNPQETSSGEGDSEEPTDMCMHLAMHAPHTCFTSSASFWLFSVAHVHALHVSHA